MVLGLAITAVAFWYAGRRAMTLFRLGRTGQPADPDRTRGIGARVWAELAEVLGQRKLFKWTVPGLAHALTFWGFLVLALTLIEGYGALFQRDFHIPWIGRMAWLGFAEDLFVVLVLVGVVVFAVIRLVDRPAASGRRSRFFGSHLGPAWFVLFMIFNVLWSLLLYRGAQVNTGNFPFPRGAFASEAVAKMLKPLGRTANDVIETAGLLVALGIVLAFLVLVMHSKHLHIFTAPFNVAFSRRPLALGALLPVYSGGKPVDFEDPGEDDKIGRGAIEDFSWKGLLDFATCTTCGACVEQCPVDIEHVDHIVDMRRYQVMIESEFPPEAGVMLRNLEHSGDPWGVGARGRLSWTEKLPFEVPVVDGSIPDDVEYLFWVGCAGALDNRGQRTTKAVAELLHEAGVKFAVLGSGETCTGDPARRIGNEYLFQELAKSNVDTLNSVGAKKIVATCAHC